jgi:hypothetical protein
MKRKKSGALQLAVGGMADPIAIDETPNYEDIVRQAYGSIGRTGVGDAPSNIDPEGFDYWVNTLKTGASTPEAFQRNFQTAVQDYLQTKPTDEVSQYVNQFISSPDYVNPLADDAASAATSDVSGAETATSAADSTPAVQMVRDYRGQEYNPNEVLKLAQQVASNFDTSSMSGGVFGTTGESVGFNYEDALRITGNSALTAPQQVALDMARYLIDQGITDLSQIQRQEIRESLPVSTVYDESGAMIGYRAEFTNPSTGEVTSRYLSPEEVARISSVEKTNEEGIPFSQQILADTPLGYRLNLPGGSQLASAGLGEIASVPIGSTYTGPGGTHYYLTYDPATGQYKFNTVGASSSDLEAIQPFLTVASFIPGVAPFAQAANAVIAASQGNYLGAALGGLGAYGSYLGAELAAASNPLSAAAVNGMDLASDLATMGSTTAQTLANVNLARAGIAGLNALNTGNVGGVLDAALSGYTQLGGTLPSGVATGVQVGNLLMAVNRGDAAGALNAAGDLAGSSDLKVAASGLRLLNALESGDPLAIVDAATNFGSRVSSGTSNATNNAYATAIRSGATPDEALAVANAVSGGDVTGTELGPLDRDEGEFAGLDTAAEQTRAANTVTIDNSEADTLEEAAALASARNPTATAFTFGGNTYNISASTDRVNSMLRDNDLAQIEQLPNFNDAYAQARDLLGPGKTFSWQGREYSTSTREENPALAAASDATRFGAGAGRGSAGSYAGFDAAAAAEAAGRSGAATTATDLNLPTDATYDAMGNLIGGQTVMGSPDLNTVSGRIANSVAGAINTFANQVATYPSSAVRAGGNLLSNVGGVIDLAAGTSTDAGNKLRELAGQVDRFANSIENPQVRAQQQAIGSAIDQAEGVLGKTAAFGSAILNNPLGATGWVFTEAFEEVPGVGLALKAGSKLGMYGILVVNDMVESGGSAYNDTYKAAIAKGMPEQEARDAARNASLTSMMATGVTQGLVEGKIISRMVGRETIGEGVEGAAQSVASQLALGEAVDPNKVIKSALIEGAVGKGASSTASGITATNDAVVSINSAISSAVASGDTQNLPATISSSIKSAVESGADASTVISLAVDSAIDAGAGVGEIVSSAVNSAVDSGADVATAISSAVGSAVSSGADASESVVSAVNSAINSGADATVAITSSVTSSINAGANASTTVASSVGSAVAAGADVNTAIAAAVEAATNAGSNVQVNSTVNPDTNVSTITAVDTNTGVTTNVTVDPSTKTVTTVTVDSTTNTETKVVTNTDTNTSVTTKSDLPGGEVSSAGDVTASTTGGTEVTQAEGAEAATSTTAPTTATRATTTTRPSLPASGGLAAGMLGGLMAPGPAQNPLEAMMLKSWETQKAVDPLAQVRAAQEQLERDSMIQNLDPRLLAVIQQRMGQTGEMPQQPVEQAAQEPSYYSYGSEDSIDDILEGINRIGEPVYKQGGYVAPLMAQGGMALPLLAKSGGALQQAHRGGREDFKDGKHVAGDGDGQSDDIPAWLADGEFVFPADVVSALGNGSTKAGTDKLYEMMHSIRDRARSKGPKDLPPPALKSPLDYLKSAKRSAK